MNCAAVLDSLCVYINTAKFYDIWFKAELDPSQDLAEFDLGRSWFGREGGKMVVGM